jgi:DNA-directed RNA polymerase, mitochondrial
MVSIEDQLELERTMKERGADNYEKAQKESEVHGRGAETAYARRLMREFMLPLIETLTAYIQEKKPGKQGRVRPLLSQCDAEKSMYMAMQAVFNHFTMEAPVAHLVRKIGRMVEDEVRFTRFQAMYKDYYDEIKKDFKRKGTKDYRFMHRVLTHKANEKEDAWTEWSAAEQAEVGTKLLDIILEGTDLIRKVQFMNHGKTKTVIAPTDSAKEWIEKHNDVSRFLFPDKMPCIIVPDDWTDVNQGGYYSPELRASTPLIKTSSKRHRQAVHRADLSQTMKAVNILQAVPWEVNTDVLEVVKASWAKNLRIGMPASDPLTIPPSPIIGKDTKNLSPAEQELFTDWKHEAAEVHTQERERVSKSYQISRIIRLANEYLRYNQFYFVWYADFRGRLYTTTSGFSPQGPDLAKSCIRFSRSKPLGDRGFYWLKVHGANRYGYDKDSYDGRVAWIDQRQDALLAAANDPLNHTDVWSNADKPWQFLAFLFEYRDALALKALGHSVSEFRSKLPIGLDGSCNGLQNFSAMLRDNVGGIATNLVPASLPSDIYAEVARVCSDKLRKNAIGEHADAMAIKWIEYCDKYGKGSIPRSLAKRPVMTLPYGATRQSCTQYIFESILETDREFFEGSFKAACWLTPYLWSSIGDVVVAARDAMDWLQKSAGVISRENAPIEWSASDGFPIYQGTRIIESVKIETQLAGRFQLKIGKFTENMDKNKQRLGIAPNFVHSCDADHLRATVRDAYALGITDLALIHDDYGTHACDTDKLHKVIRSAFVTLYSENDPLAAFKAANEAEGITLPDLPMKGDLDLASVADSRYFFG